MACSSSRPAITPALTQSQRTGGDCGGVDQGMFAGNWGVQMLIVVAVQALDVAGTN